MPQGLAGRGSRPPGYSWWPSGRRTRVALATCARCATRCRDSAKRVSAGRMRDEVGPCTYDARMTRVLLAEDDQAISEPLARALRREGYEVEVCEDGPGALKSASGSPVDLVVLDIGLPGMDGLEVCRRLRTEGSGVPVLVLTPRTDEVDTVLGLAARAGHYVN